MSSRFHLGSALALGLVLSVGCQSSKDDPSPERVSQLAGPIAPATSEPPQDGPVPVTVPQEPDTVTALTRKAEWYAQNLGPVVAQHANEAPGTAPSPIGHADAHETGQLPPQPTIVQPSETQALVLPTPSPTAPAVTSPVSQTTAAAEPPAMMVADTTPVPSPTQTIVAPTSVAPTAPVSPPVEPAVASLSQQSRRMLVVSQDTDTASRLTQRIKDDPQDVAAHLDYQLMRFVKDEPVPDLPALEPLPSEDREIVAALLDGLSNFRSGLRADANMLMSRKVRPLIDMGDRIGAQADLTLTKAALCSKVVDFGVYDEITPPRFIAGRDNSAILYCEVSHFASQLNGQNLWETRLSYEAVLYTDAELGLAVDHRKPQVIVDTCRSRRGDYFFADRVILPSNLTIGRYILKVTVIDQFANRIAETAIPLQIVAK